MKKSLLIILTCLLAFSCQREEKSIIIGHISPLSGDNARWGVWESEGIDLAVENINKNKSLLNYKLLVLHEDSKGEPTIGVSALQKLMSQGIQAIIGGTLSGTTLACSPIAEKRKVVLLTPSAQSPKITNAGDYIFRIFASNVVEGKELVNLSEQFRFHTVSLLYANTEYGVGLFSVVKRNAILKGKKIISEEAYNPELRDFRSQLTMIKNANPEAIFLLGFPKDMGIILRQIKELNISAYMFAPNSFEEEEIINLSKGGAEGVNYVYPILQRTDELIEINQQFFDKYKHEMNYYNGVGYDAVMVLAKAIAALLEANKDLSGENIKNTLYEINYNGLSGPISFDKNGDVKFRPMEFRVVRNNKFERLESEQ